MAYKNLTQFLVAATALPAAIEAKLPAGAPKLSTTLVDVATKLPILPDFPMEVPDLPAIPELPGLPGAPAGLRRFVTGVEVTPYREIEVPSDARVIGGGYRGITG